MNRNVFNYADCVKYVLHQKGFDADDFENTDMRVYYRRVANPLTIFKTLKECTTAFVNDGTYTPKLLDLTYVELPDGLDELLEAMAENAHDMWARERQSEGWTYGPERNDQLLETPDMVPYARLAESEKQYDRIMAADT